MATKTVISLKIKQNIDLLQRATLKKGFISGKKKTLKFWFDVNMQQQRR